MFGLDWLVWEVPGGENVIKRLREIERGGEESESE